MAEKYYTVADYAKMRNITETAVYSSIKRNRLKTVDMRNEETGRTVKYVVVDENQHIQQQNEEAQKENDIIQQLYEVLTLQIQAHKEWTELVIQQFQQDIDKQFQHQNELQTKHFEQLQQDANLRFKLLQQEFELILEQSKHYPVFEKDYFEHFQKQLEEKDKQIQQQNELFARSQELHRQTNTLLQKEEPEAAAIVPVEPPKKSFFARLFHK